MKNIRRILGMLGVAAGVSLTPVAGQTAFDSSKAGKADQKIELKQAKWDEKAEKADRKAEKADEKIALKQLKWKEKAEKADRKIELKQLK